MFTFFVLATICCYGQAGPSSIKQDIPADDVFKFLRRYGYLEGGISDDAESLYSADAVVEAVRQVQRYGEIPETGVIDNATLQLMESPRCGVPDITRNSIHGGNSPRTKRYVVGAPGWTKRNITYFIANWSPKIGEEAVITEMIRAFDSWAGYAKLTFQRVYDPSADIIVAFGSGHHGDPYPFDGPGNILAHAYYPHEMGSYGGDIHFDDDEKWKTGPDQHPDRGDTDFFTVAVHELGHSLGLAHSPVSSSVMFPYYKGTKNGFQLDYDDILAMYELYISRRLFGDDFTSTPSSIDAEDVSDPVSPPSTTERPQKASTSPYADEDGIDSDSPVSEPSTTTRRPVRTTVLPPQRTTDRSKTSTRDYTVTYTGDYETVDVHKTHDTKHGLGPTIPLTPEICAGKIDSVALLRQELFVFKKQYLWRLRDRGTIQTGYPVLIKEMFPLPDGITSVDAAYERDDGVIVLFTGNMYWVYDGFKFVNSPRQITDYGLPNSLDKVDAAQVWHRNGKLYLYRGDQFWRFNEATRSMDEGYPLYISRWKGLPTYIDAAVTFTDERTYFFKGNFVYQFNNERVEVETGYPRPFVHEWFGCPKYNDTVYVVL